jgi:hypothetical protein
MSQKLLGDLIAPFDGVLGRVWRLRPGDQCSTCPMRSECRDRTTCLHMISSAGLSTRLDGPFRRFPIGAREVGRVMLSATPFVANGNLARLGLADSGWLALHGIRSFAAFPLRRDQASVGVFALFARRELGPSDVRGLSAAAVLLALSVPPAGSAERGPLRPIQEVERETIERTLAHTRGRVSGPRGAAVILGLKPTTLQSRMKKLGVRRPGRSA